MKETRSRERRSATAQRGQVALLFGLMLTAILGVVALAIDGGNLYFLRRQLQAATDLAALSGAQAIYNGTTADAVAQASSYAALNGSPGATVNVPPTSGPHTGDSMYVEVIAQRVASTFFANILGMSQVTVDARSVARAGRDTPPYALLALSTNANPGISFGGSSTIQIRNAGVMSNSGVDPSIKQTSSSGSVQSDGPINATGTIIGTYTAPSVTSGVPPYPDPLAQMPPPTFGSPGTDAPTTRNATQNHPNTLVIPSSGGPLPGSVTSCGTDEYNFCPGVYWGGIHISGGRYTMSPGIYVFAGSGFSMSGGSLAGTGLFLFSTNDPKPSGGNYGGATGDYGPISINSNQTVDLSASHVPLYSGMAGNVLIYQDRNSTAGQASMSLQANGNTTLYGTIYLPTVGIAISGGGSTGAAQGQVIAYTASFSGSSAGGITYDSNWAVVYPGSTLVE